jgi:hypothetical protein
MEHPIAKYPCSVENHICIEKALYNIVTVPFTIYIECDGDFTIYDETGWSLSKEGSLVTFNHSFYTLEARYIGTKICITASNTVLSLYVDNILITSCTMLESLPPDSSGTLYTPIGSQWKHLYIHHRCLSGMDRALLHRMNETCKEGKYMHLDNNFNVKRVYSNNKNTEEDGTYVCYNQEKDSNHFDVLCHPRTIFNLNKEEIDENDDDDGDVKPGSVMYVDGIRYRAHHI